RRPFASFSPVCSMNERRSAVIVTVLPALLTWVRERGIRRPYFPEQYCIWLITPVSSFNAGTLERYLQQLQTLMLSAELERFGPNLVPAIARTEVDVFGEAIRSRYEPIRQCGGRRNRAVTHPRDVVNAPISSHGRS